MLRSRQKGKLNWNTLDCLVFVCVRDRMSWMFRGVGFGERLSEPNGPYLYAIDCLGRRATDFRSSETDQQLVCFRFNGMMP